MASPPGRIAVHDRLQGDWSWPINMWGYEPVGRCELAMYSTSLWNGPELYETYDSFEHTLDRFADRMLPVFSGGVVVAYDAEGVAVLGYNNSAKARRHAGPYGWWFGVRRAFEMLERRWDPMEVAIWEIIARDDQ